MGQLESFEPDFAAPGDWAAMYRAAGWQVVPAHMPRHDGDWKFPALTKWKTFQDKLVPDTQFNSWYGPRGEYSARPNMGILAGQCSRNIFVIDLDEYKDHQALTWWRGILAVHNNGIEPETCQQITGGGGRQLFFCARVDWAGPTNKTKINVDIRGQGGFAMLPPSQHVSGTPYAWKVGCAPWEIEVADAPEWLLEAVLNLVAEHGRKNASDPAAPSGERTPSPEHLNAFGLHDDLREDYMSRSIWGNLVAWHRECPIKPSPPESRARMEDAFAAYERKTKSRLPAAAGSSNADLLEREGRGASLFAKKWARDFEQWDEDIKIDADKGRPAQLPVVVAAPIAPIGIALQSAFPISEASIPPRDWVIPGLFLRRHLSVLVAPPGSGKSLLTLQLAIAIATGRSWGGWKVRAAKKVLVVNAEDDTDEMRRRLFAAALEMKIPQSELEGRIFLADAPESIVIARADSKTKTVVRTPLLEELVHTVKEHGIGCVIVDPFAETFEGDENSNSEIKWAGILWREVARRTDSSVMLVHHTKKYAGAMAGDADASRGGGALIGTARILSTLFAMTEEEAVTLNITPEDRTKYVRFDDAKANLSLVTGQAKWFEKRGVTLKNGSGIVPGDEVGVLRPWEPPGMFDGVSMHTIGQILDTIDRGLLDEDGIPTGQYFTIAATSSSKDRWAGGAVSRLLGCDEKRSKQILNIWKKTGVLETYEYQDPIARKARSGVRSVLNNRPDRAPE